MYNKNDNTALLYFIYDKPGVKCLVETIYNNLRAHYPVLHIIIAIVPPIYYA
jgi:hypothetical protein